MGINIRSTIVNDLDFVIETESNPENSIFIGNWDFDKHKESLTDKNIKHLIVEDLETNKKIGYLILSGLCSKNKSLELVRIVITEKGKGFGRQAIEIVKEFAFATLGFHRLWLDVRVDNLRAKHLYESCGFSIEGLIRECIYADNKYHSLYLLSILKSEYL